MMNSAKCFPGFVGTLLDPHTIPRTTSFFLTLLKPPFQGLKLAKQRARCCPEIYSLICSTGRGGRLSATVSPQNQNQKCFPHMTAPSQILNALGTWQLSHVYRILQEQLHCLRRHSSPRLLLLLLHLCLLLLHLCQLILLNGVPHLLLVLFKPQNRPGRQALGTSSIEHSSFNCHPQLPQLLQLPQPLRPPL